MGSAAKFWPARLFSRGKKNDQVQFVPTTDIAARIIGARASEEPESSSSDQTKHATFGSVTSSPSLDDLQFTSSEIDGLEEDVEGQDDRQANRFVPDKTSTTVTDARGKSMRARIINLSATGVAVEADFRTMAADTIAMVGAKPVRLGRSIRGGQVFLFDKPLDPSRNNKQIVL